MDETDVLFRVKNSFYLGNFKSVLDVWLEVVQTGVSLSPKIEEQVGSLIQRMAVIYLRNNEKVVLMMNRSSLTIRKLSPGLKTR